MPKRTTKPAPRRANAGSRRAQRTGDAAPPERGAETRARIVAAALREFADRGFEGTSTREISAVAGVNQGLITYHFASKESLWKEAVDKRWLSDTMWRARLWIPYSSMPIGLGLLALQAIVDFANLAAGRDAPFGIGEARR